MPHFRPSHQVSMAAAPAMRNHFNKESTKWSSFFIFSVITAVFPHNTSSRSDFILSPDSMNSTEHFFINSAMLKTIEQDMRQQHHQRAKRATDEADALSQNITMILEDLLKDYDKTERPNFKSGSPTRVKINILIRSMGPISEEDMNYSMDCYFRQYWRDERLSFTGVKKNAHSSLAINHLSLNIKMLEKIWKPDTYFHNGLSSYLHTITRPNKLLRISEHGDITYSMRLTIKAKCPMMLRSFPMDWQSCPLVIGSFAYTADEVLYVWTDPAKAVGYEGQLQLSQFDIKHTSFRGLNYSRGETVGTYSCLQVVIALQRHTGYFLIQIYLPCTLLVVLSWVGFWLNREATSDRVGLGITTVLTLSTIALESRTDLPKVHYATALDWFIICSFAYCIATLLEFAGVHYFTKVGSGEVFSFSLDDNDDERVNLIANEPDHNRDDDDEGGVNWPDYCNNEEQRPIWTLSHNQQHQRFSSSSSSSEMAIRHNPGCATFKYKYDDVDKRHCCCCRHRNRTRSRLNNGKNLSAENPVFNLDRDRGCGCRCCCVDEDEQEAAAVARYLDAAKSFPPCDFYSNNERLQPGIATTVRRRSLESIDMVEDSDVSFCLPPPPEPPSMAKFSSSNGDIFHPSLSRLSMANSFSVPAALNNHNNDTRGAAVMSLNSEVVALARKSRRPSSYKRRIHDHLTPPCWKQFLFCLLANQSYRKQRQKEASKHGGMNSTSRIDSVARILFPLSFGLFNFAYWYSYFQGQKPFDWEDHVLSGNILSI